MCQKESTARGNDKQYLIHCKTNNISKNNYLKSFTFKTIQKNRFQSLRTHQPKRKIDKRQRLKDDVIDVDHVNINKQCNHKLPKTKKREILTFQRRYRFFNVSDGLQSLNFSFVYYSAAMNLLKMHVCQFDLLNRVHHQYRLPLLYLLCYEFLGESQNITISILWHSKSGFVSSVPRAMLHFLFYFTPMMATWPSLSTPHYNGTNLPLRLKVVFWVATITHCLIRAPNPFNVNDFTVGRKH